MLWLLYTNDCIRYLIYAASLFLIYQGINWIKSNLNNHAKVTKLVGGKARILILVHRGTKAIFFFYCTLYLDSWECGEKMNNVKSATQDSRNLCPAWSKIGHLQKERSCSSCFFFYFSATQRGKKGFASSRRCGDNNHPDKLLTLGFFLNSIFLKNCIISLPVTMTLTFQWPLSLLHGSDFCHLAPVWQISVVCFPLCLF